MACPKSDGQENPMDKSYKMGRFSSVVRYTALICLCKFQFLVLIVYVDFNFKLIPSLHVLVVA